jgi:folate-binding protein YgfZ
MSECFRIDLGLPACIDLRGPDAVRYLNGQVTQDVRRVSGSVESLPSCVTDAKGRFQFRVWITALPDGSLRVDCPGADPDALEAHLTRYLIADDAEAENRSGRYRLVHFTADPGTAPEGVLVRNSSRFAVPGVDWWFPVETELSFPESIPPLAGDALEDFRIRHGVPLAGSELTSGILPPEAGLDATDISYQKGCYIGQEVISRIKSAGKVNRKIASFTTDASWPISSLALVDADGKPAGEITSVSPIADGKVRHLLAYVKRGAENVRIVIAD